MRKSILLACAIIITFWTSGAFAASFDCRRARSPDEIAVCSDPVLSEMDERVSVAFAQAKFASGERVIGVGRRFLASRRACGADRACIGQVYQAMAEAYSQLGSGEEIRGSATPQVRTLPKQIGDCVTTTVADVTPRLDPRRAPISEDFDSGTAINFANGGHQVSYEREEALMQSRIGDPTRMCLISIPRNCPPNDNRGRVYSTTNLRTRQTWSLPDAQHVCGGA